MITAGRSKQNVENITERCMKARLRWFGNEIKTMWEHKHVAEWLRAWDTLTMFEVTVCGRS